MRKLFLGFFLGVGVLFSLFGVGVFSHKIPPEFLEFLSENPDATEAEIEIFLDKIFPGNEFENFTKEIGDIEVNALPEPIRIFITENREVTEALLNDFITLHPEIADQSLFVFQNIYPEVFKLSISSSEKEEIKDLNQSDLSFSRNENSLDTKMYDKKTPGNSNIFWNNAKNFIRLGVQHILGGIDHVLFVLALVLVWIPFKKLLLVITTFTLGHSLTLLFSGTNIFLSFGNIVEPIIALSIAYVAITSVFSHENSWFKKTNHKLGVVFLFGLFHGLGFAGVFSTMDLNTEYEISSLLFFNIGIEIGQIGILLGAIPFLFFLRKTSWANIIIEGVAVFISLLAFYWFLERISLV